jgi:hypothetical protein
MFSHYRPSPQMVTNPTEYTPSHIVMLSGWAGSGKDTVANIMTSEHRYTRFAFADALKDDVHQCTGIPMQILHSPYMKMEALPFPIDGFPDAITYRDVIIQHAARQRALDNDIYSRKVVDEICAKKASRVVISDWRYQREYEVLKEAFPEVTVRKVVIRNPSVSQMDIPSEHDLDDITMDTIIHNNNTLTDLALVVKTLFA